MKLIHTRLYSDYAEQFIRVMVKKITQAPGRYYTKFEGMKVARQPNGEVVFKVNDDSWSYRKSIGNKYSESDALTWMARTFKWLTQHKRHEWSRDNVCENIGLTLINAAGETVFCPTVQETYAIYDIFVNRKRLESKYSKEVLDKVQGTEKDAVATELETARREEIAKINEKWTPIINDLDTGYWASTARKDVDEKLHELRIKLENEWAAKRAKAKADRDAELAEINKMTAFVNTSEFPFN